MVHLKHRAKSEYFRDGVCFTPQVTESKPVILYPLIIIPQATGKPEETQVNLNIPRVLLSPILCCHLINFTNIMFIRKPKVNEYIMYESTYIMFRNKTKQKL